MMHEDKISILYIGVVVLLRMYLIRTERVHMSKWMRTDIAQNVNIYNFEIRTGQDIQNCIDTCKSKKQCKFINFHRRMSNTCFLIGANIDENFKTEDYVERKSGFIFGDTREWNMTGYEVCDECNGRGVCKTVEHQKYSMCLNSGCVPPIQKCNAVHFGNLYSIGKTVRYKCVDGYRNKPTDVVLSTCTENGNWSMADITCVPEAAFGDDIFEFNCTFYKLLRKEQNWDDTKQACEELGGHLVYIKSQEEDNFIETEIASLENFWCHWIGGRRHDGELTWLDGTLVADGYTNYHPGEPNYNNGNEDCMMLWNFGTGIKWNDAHCYSNFCRAICELV